MTSVRCRILTLLIGAYFAQPAAAQVDTSNWKCELCPFASGYEATYEAGAEYVSDSSLRFGNATGLDEAGGVLALDGEGRYASDDFQLRWLAEDLALDARELRLEAGRQGSYGIYVGLDELPYRQFDTAATVFNVTGTNFLALPPSWVTAGTTANMTELDASLRPLPISSDRRTITAGGHLLPGSNFRLFADYRRDDRDGIQITSGSAFTQSAMLPRVVDYQTDIIDLGVSYSNGPLVLALAWYGSFFANNSASLTWENPWFDDPATVGFEPHRMALEPDNDFQQLSLSGSYRFKLLDTTLSFGIANGRGRQNEPLLPYTSNVNLAAAALPRESLDGKVDTANYSLTLTSRPVRKGKLNIFYRFDERDNGTPQSTWTRVITDTFVSADPEANTPWSFERQRLGISGEYLILDGLRLSAGFERTAFDREFQEVAEQTEDSGWGRARWRPTGWLDVSVRGGSSRREIDRYDESVAAGFGQNPLLRKYNLAYRYREFGELTMSFSPLDWPVSATLAAMVTEDSYTQSQLGITAGESEQFSVDLGWSVTDSAYVYAVIGRDSMDATQLGSEAFGMADWTAFYDDSFDHWGGGIEIRNVGESTDIVVDYTNTTGETGIRMLRSGTSVSDYPDIDSDFESFRVKLRYRRSERLDVDLNLRYEMFRTNDWALAGVDPDTIPNVLALGADPYDYGVWVVGLGFRYLIGGREVSFPE